MSDSQTTAIEELPASGGDDVKPIAETSAAEPSGKGVENKTMLDAVKAALDGTDKSPTSDNGQETKSAPSEDPNSPEAEAKAEDEWLKSQSKDTQKRIRELANGRREALQQVDSLKAKAEEFDRLDGMIRENLASPEDLKGALEITRLINTGDARGALAKLQPIVKALLKAEGHELPDDLKADVESGAITQARAQELARERNRSSRLEQDQQAQAQEAERRKFQDSTDRMARDVDKWAADQKTTDPDWHLKLGRVTEKFELRLGQMARESKFPTSEQEVRTILEEAKKQVDAELKQFMPKPKASTSHTGQVSSAAKPAAKSVLDIVRQHSGNA